MEEAGAEIIERTSEDGVMGLGGFLKAFEMKRTIDRIDTDDYGFCDQCGVEIGIRRLEARPTATLCIDCKTLAEIRERQTGI